MKYHVKIKTTQGETSSYDIQYLSSLEACIASTGKIFGCPINALTITITIRNA